MVDIFELIDRIQDIVTLIAIPIAIWLLWKINKKVSNS